LAIKFLIYCVGEKEESTRHSAEECHPPPVVSWGLWFIRKENNGQKIVKIKRSLRFE